MMDEICKHCKYKRFTCPLFPCDPYKEAKLKHKARWYQNAFPIEDYDGEDRYVAGLIFKWIMVIGWLLFMAYCTILYIGGGIR